MLLEEVEVIKMVVRMYQDPADMDEARSRQVFSRSVEQPARSLSSKKKWCRAKLKASRCWCRMEMERRRRRGWKGIGNQPSPEGERRLRNALEGQQTRLLALTRTDELMKTMSRTWEGQEEKNEARWVTRLD